jgi:hypothetical protein
VNCDFIDLTIKNNHRVFKQHVLFPVSKLVSLKDANSTSIEEWKKLVS